jgi:hypothetical protein
MASNPQQMKITAARRSQRVQVLNVNDFTGGLNLLTDTFRLGSTESPDMLNVDVDRRGGFQSRRGVTPVNSTALASDPTNVWSFRNSAGADQLMAQVGYDVFYSTGSNFTSIALDTSMSGPMRAATFKDVNYITRRTVASVKWTGTTKTVLTANGATWQDDLLLPTGGYMPTAKLIAAHMGFMWVANTLESTVAYPNRLRFSHDNLPEDWRQLDFIDIDTGKDGDVITAIFPFSDHLVVCKRNSTYAVYGFSASTFSVVNISNTVGCVSQEAGVNTPAGLYIFDPDTGVHLYTGKNSLDWKFTQLFPAVRDGSIVTSSIENVMLGWVNDRLWVSVPWAGTPYRSRTFVHDPRHGAQGSWTAYDLKAGPFASAFATNVPISVQYGAKRAIRLEQSVDYDDFGLGTQNFIKSHYVTRWIDAGQPTMKKRWKRSDFVLHSGQPTDVSLSAEVFVDYDRTVAKKQFSLISPAGSSDPFTWDTSRWDSTTQAFERAGTIDEIDKGASMGLARAVSIKINGPQNQNTNWGVDAIVFKFIPRRVR